jgi:hypothetical protein
MKDFAHLAVDVVTVDKRFSDIKFSKNVKDIDVGSLRLSQETKKLICFGKKEGDRYKSRSEADFAVICAMANSGYGHDDIRAVFEKYPIGKKFREHDKGAEYLAHSIAKAKSKLAENDEPYVNRPEEPETDDSDALFDEDIPAIPVSLIPPGFIKDYIDTLEPLSEAPVQFHIGAALMLIAAAVRRNVYVQWGFVHLFPNLYVIIIGRSGMARKTTALMPVAKIFTAVYPKGFFTNVTSAEAFYTAFTENPDNVMVYSEFKTFLDNIKKGYGEGLMIEITNLWDNPDSLNINFKKIDEEKRIVKNPSLSIFAATTVEWLTLSEVEISGGFFGRFLPILGSSKRVKYIAKPPALDKQKFEALMKKLEEISGKRGECTFTEEATQKIEQIYKVLSDEYDKLPNQHLLSSHWSRIQPHIIKIAMILKLSEYPPKLEIDKEAIERASTIMRYITKYYRHLMGSMPLSDEMKKENKILELLGGAKKDGLKHSELLRQMGLGAPQFYGLITTLIEKEEIVKIDERSKTKHGKKYYLKK